MWSDGQIELTSGGQPDVEERGWGYLNCLFENGWNELYLPIRWSDKTGGELNAQAVNFMRIYAEYGDCKVAFDDIYFRR